MVCWVVAVVFWSVAGVWPALEIIRCIRKDKSYEIGPRGDVVGFVRVACVLRVCVCI